MVRMFLKSTLRDAFGVALATYIVYFFADLVLPGLVSNYINMNVLLLWVIGLGVMTVLLTESRNPTSPPLEKGREFV